MRLRDIIIMEWDAPVSSNFLHFLELYLITQWSDMGDSMRDGVQEAFDAEMPVLPPQTVYRGLRLESPDDLETGGAEFKEGAVITFPGYLSASTERQAALDYAVINGDPTAMLLEIETAPGARGIAVADYRQWLDGGDDDEIILDRGGRFNVVSISETPRAGGFPEDVLVDVKLRQVL